MRVLLLTMAVCGFAIAIFFRWVDEIGATPIPGVIQILVELFWGAIGVIGAAILFAPPRNKAAKLGLMIAVCSFAIAIFLRRADQIGASPIQGDGKQSLVELFWAAIGIVGAAVFLAPPRNNVSKTTDEGREAADNAGQSR